MAQLNSTEFKIQTQTLFPTNGIGGITAADLRTQMDNLSDSTAFIKTGQSTAPSPDDDNAGTASNGVFQVGHFWLDETNNIAYLCIDNTTGAAQWLNITNRISEIKNITSNKTLALSDIGSILEIDTTSGAVELTLPTTASVAIPVGSEFNVTLIDSTSAATIGVSSGVEVNGTTSVTIVNTDYSTVRIYKRTANSWVVSGDIV